jgi:hypothetical protein
LLFFGVKFASQLLAFGLKFLGALDHEPVLGHVALLHSLVSGLKIADIVVITLQIFVGGSTAQRRAGL